MNTKILLIDDEEIIRRRLSQLLTLDSYQVFTAENGPTGIELFKVESPDVILCDIKMPGMDGIEVLKQIKALSTTTLISAAPVSAIAATGESQDAESLKARSSDVARITENEPPLFDGPDSPHFAPV